MVERCYGCKHHRCTCSHGADVIRHLTGCVADDVPQLDLQLAVAVAGADAVSVVVAESVVVAVPVKLTLPGVVCSGVVPITAQDEADMAAVGLDEAAEARALGARGPHGEAGYSTLARRCGNGHSFSLFLSRVFD